MYLPLYKNRAVSLASQKLIASLTLFALILLHPPSYCSPLSPTTPKDQADPIGTTQPVFGHYRPPEILLFTSLNKPWMICIALAKEKQNGKDQTARSDTSFASSTTNEQVTSFRSPLSELESKLYYYGLFSKAVLVARSGTDIWEPPTGYEASLRPKELRPSGNHPIKAVWEDKLGPKIYNILESTGVQWTSIDLPRIGFSGELFAPVVVWIGVKPNTLSGIDGLAVAKECEQLLVASEILDAEVEIRESVVTTMELRT